MGYDATIPSGPSESRPGPFLARVVSHLDPTNMGVLEVEILRPSGNAQTSGQLHQVRMLSPFYGVTNIEHVGDEDDYNNTQKSYGMWFVPPDPGTLVMVIFIDGDPKRGYWIGCVMDEAMNFMLPGLAATEYSEGSGRLPVGEYNKKVNHTVNNPTKVKKPRHPIADALEKQGLLKDDIRGITTSSARREVPSSVFGISTPGPIDRKSGAKRGRVGKSDSFAPNAFVSRLGGSSIVMDDGDEKFHRKKPASKGKPEYAATEQGETDGDPEIPHNELIRIRTRTGHQILLHNSEDLIYIGNASGTTWIELTSNGKIDIYAKDSVSIHTENDLNFTADRDINFTANRNINMNCDEKLWASANTDFTLKATMNGRIACGPSLILGGAVVNIKGPPATPLDDAPKANRIPLHEPWGEHENLDPEKYKPDATEAKPDSKPSDEYTPEYTTTTDTFANVKGAD